MQVEETFVVSNAFTLPSFVAKMGKPIRQDMICILLVCLTSVAISVNDTNYGPLIQTLQPHLHGDAGTLTLMLATPFFVGMILANILGAGIVADHCAARPLMTGALLLLCATEVLLPFPPDAVSPLLWVAFWRVMAGISA